MSLIRSLRPCTLEQRRDLTKRWHRYSSGTKETTKPRGSLYDAASGRATDPTVHLSSAHRRQRVVPSLGERCSLMRLLPAYASELYPGMSETNGRLQDMLRHVKLTVPAPSIARSHFHPQGHLIFINGRLDAQHDPPNRLRYWDPTPSVSYWMYVFFAYRAEGWKKRLFLLLWNNLYPERFRPVLTPSSSFLVSPLLSSHDDGAHRRCRATVRNGLVAFAACGRVSFPAPMERNVNMMPFRLGDIHSLPAHLHCYYPMIEQCPYVREDEGQVAYVTVHESHAVPAGSTQRRPGWHIEAVSSSSSSAHAMFTPAVEHSWGMGIAYGPDQYEGGIYMASTVADSCRLWDALVDPNGVADPLGGLPEDLRPYLGPSTAVEENELVWMTDCTPHEATVPIAGAATAASRQYFRLVMPSISHWYADHSTANPNVALPRHVTVVHGNKFLQ